MVLSQPKPKVSVLTPIYNTEPIFLRECIESILNQSFTDFEFIILNDSPDNKELEQIVRSYEDARIKYYANEKNLGISASRNRLLELASGDYVAIFDHDDISLPNRLEKEVEFLDTHLAIGVVGSFTEWFDENNERKIMKCPQYDHEIRCALTDDCYLAHTSVMIRKDILVSNNIRYQDFYSPCEDYQLFNQLLVLTHFYVIQEPLVRYRTQGARVSKIKREQMHVMADVIRFDIRNRYPYYYKRYVRLVSKRAICRCRLFGVIPFIKIKNNKVYLFDCILLCKIKWK